MLQKRKEKILKNKSQFQQIVERIKRNWDRLSPREQEILSWRYGLKDGYPHTLAEVGEKFQVTKERIRQLEFLALWKVGYRK